MGKIIFIVLLVLGLVFVASSLSSYKDNLISPAKQEVLSEQQKIDDKLFERYKTQVRGEDLKWAEGKGLVNNYVQEGLYIVVDGKGKVIYEKDLGKRVSPASLSKIMTAMVALDFAKMDEVFDVPKEAVNLEPTILMVEEGERLSVSDLLKATLLTSANDAAYVLSYGVSKKLGGSNDLFIKFMNEKAKKIGMGDSRFANATGYDDDKQYSTARDLSRMANFALTKYPEIKNIVGIREATIEQSDIHKYYELPNWNSLLGVYPGVDGVKIGHTDNAKHSMIVTAEREGEKFMVVLLEAPDRRARDFWSADLLNSAFEEKGIKKFRVTLSMLQKRSQEWSDQLTLAKEKTIPFADVLKSLSTRGN